MISVSKLNKQIIYATSLAIALVFASHASAQLEIYNTLNFTDRHTNISNQNVNFTSPGYEAGVLYDGHRHKGVSSGLDLRGSLSANFRFGLVGFRAAMHPKETKGNRAIAIPYAEFLVGGGTFGDSQGNQDAHMFCEGVVGADIPMGVIDFRILEVGIGRTPFGNSTGAAYTGGNLWLVTESSGIVYRF